jgi:hypothetical protein
MIPRYVQDQISQAERLRWKLYWPRTALVDILKPAGFATGLYADHDAGTRKVKIDIDGEPDEVEVGHQYYPVLARVLATYQCLWIKPGDVVRFTAMNYEDTPSEPHYPVMYERCMLAVIEGFDEAAVA